MTNAKELYCSTPKVKTHISYHIIYVCLPNRKRKNMISFFTELSNYFKPGLSVIAPRFNFYSARESFNESTREWCARLCEFASSYEFESSELQCILRDIFIIGSVR